MNYKILSPQDEGFFLNLNFLFKDGNVVKKNSKPVFKNSLLLLAYKDSESKKEESELAAYCLFRKLPDDIIEIDYIETNSKYKRMGFAAFCLKSIISSSNPLKVWLEVSELNKLAVAFYEKNGFLRDSVRKDYYNKGEDAFLYSLNLQKE